MFKVIGPGLAKIIFAIFMIGVFVLMLLLTGGSLEKIFPGDIVRQTAGYLLFDVGALVWLIIMVKGSRGIMQRAIAFVCFLLDVLGTLGMAGAAAFMSGQELVAVDPMFNQAIIWIFIAASAWNLVGLYAHHIFDLETESTVRSENHVDKLKSQAMDKADQKIEANADALAEKLAQAYYNQADTEIQQLVSGLSMRAQAVRAMSAGKQPEGVIDAKFTEVKPAPAKAVEVEAVEIDVQANKIAAIMSALDVDQRTAEGALNKYGWALGSYFDGDGNLARDLSADEIKRAWSMLGVKDANPTPRRKPATK